MSTFTAFFFALVVYTLFSDLVGSGSLEIVKYVLLRGVALVSLMAFHSVEIQLLGLIGANGLIPISSTLLKLKEFSNRSANVWKEPIKYCMKHLLTLVFQKFHTVKDINLHVSYICRIDMIVSVVCFVYPHPVLFVYLYFSYYSYKRIMDRFLNYQWDALLLETLLLSTILSLSFDSLTTTLGMWQFKILLFRLMFGSGVVKYFGRDESWHTSYTAMCYHFLTQPLPSSLGMYIHTHSPQWFLKGMTVGTLVVELLLPLISLLNLSVINWLVGVSYIGLQISIGISGYYGFFGSLTSVLSLSLLNDWFVVQAVSLTTLSLVPVETVTTVLMPHPRSFTLVSLLSMALSCIVIYPLLAVVTVVQLKAIHSLLQYIPLFKSESKDETPRDDDSDDTETKTECDAQRVLTLKDVSEALEKLHHFSVMTLFLGCHYGLFASMTKVRNEFTVSLSADKLVWHELDFAFKPGSANLAPKSVSRASRSGVCFYHMPRLDWSMWFLPFSNSKASYPRWLWVLLISILEGNQDVLNLFLLSDSWKTFAPGRADDAKDDPTASEPQRIVYEGKAMQYIRVQLMNYTYADAKTVAEEGKYWNVQFVRDVVSPSSVEDLYELLDAYDKVIYGADQNTKPRAETAQEIIARMLRFAQKQKNQQEGKQN